MNYWNNKAYYTLNQYLKERFHKKVIKLSLDGGFTCPNRDGTIGHRGCIFCGEEGAGEFTSDANSIHLQMKQQVDLLSEKWKNASYIAYFQSFTNTYAPANRLKSLYDEALSFPGTVGLAIATRPDCLSDEVLELLSSYHKKTFLWVELGLQTIHEETAAFLRRGYPLSVFEEALEKLQSLGIPTVSHIIVNLPSETRQDVLDTVTYLSHRGIWGLKIHILYISSDTDLYPYYLAHPFPLMEREEYIDTVADLLCHISPDIVIHRLTGDGDKKTLIAPNWIKDKRAVLNGIDRKMRTDGLYQGKYWKIKL